MPPYEPIYRVVRRIPPGRVATYGMIATLAGYVRAARFVGLAMHHCRDGTVPCHRVVNASGGLAPGFLSQRARLEHEGVRFVGARVDLARSLWSPRWPGHRTDPGSKR